MVLDMRENSAREKGKLLSHILLTIVLLVTALSVPTFPQSSNPQMIDVYIKWGNADYLDLSGKKVLSADKKAVNLESFVVGYKAWNLMGDFVYNPSFYYEIDRTYLSGRTQNVYFDKISKYPDLAKRYKAMRPSSVNFVITVDLVTTDGKSKTVNFKVTHNNLVYYESRSPKNFQVPTSPANGKWKYAFSSAPIIKSTFTDQDFSDEKELRQLLKDLQDVRPCSVACGGAAKISFDIKWPDDAIDEIGRLYEQYEKEGAKLDEELRTIKEADRLVKPVAAYNKADEMAAPFEEEGKSAEVFDEGKRVGLRAKGKVVFESTNYVTAEPLKGSTSLFAFRLKGRDTGYHLYNARGQQVSVDGHSTFLNMSAGKQSGTFRLIIEDYRSAVYTSKRMYYEAASYFDEQEFDNFKRSDQQPPKPYTGGGGGGGLILAFPRYKVTFYRGIAYTVDAKMNVLSKEPVFYPGEFERPNIGDRIIEGDW